MNQKEFKAFYKNIEVFDYGDSGYIYYYGTNIPMCRQRLSEISEKTLDEIIAYIKAYDITSTIVLTKITFWKSRQLKLNRKLAHYGCHMNRNDILTLYECNEYILKNNLDWQKKWENQPIYRSAVDAKKRKNGWFDMF